MPLSEYFNAMSIHIEKIEQEVLSLPISARARIVDSLLDSMTATDSSEYELEWACECRSRMEAFDRGDVQAVNGDSVFEKLEARYRQ